MHIARAEGCRKGLSAARRAYHRLHADFGADCKIVTEARGHAHALQVIGIRGFPDAEFALRRFAEYRAVPPQAAARLQTVLHIKSHIADLLSACAPRYRRGSRRQQRQCERRQEHFLRLHFTPPSVLLCKTHNAPHYCKYTRYLRAGQIKKPRPGIPGRDS